MKETSRFLSIIRAMIIDQSIYSRQSVCRMCAGMKLVRLCMYWGKKNCPTIVLYLWILGNSKRIGNSIPEYQNSLTYPGSINRLARLHPGQPPLAISVDTTRNDDWWQTGYIVREDGWLLGGRAKRVQSSSFGFITEVRTTRLFYIYGSWVSKRILILRDRIPNSLTITQDP